MLDGKCYLVELQTTNSRIPGVTDLNTDIMNGLKRKLYSYVDLDTVLKGAGFNVIKSKDELKENESVDFDFSVVDKDTLIKFFSDTAQTEEKVEKSV